MKRTHFIHWISVFTPLCYSLFLFSCNSPVNNPNPTPSGPPVASLPNGATLPSITGANVLSLTVNGSLCSSSSYLNKPCVNVTICEPGNTSNCQTLTNILLDTGSYGLRVFKSVLNASVLSSLTPITVNGQTLAECVQYGDGSQDWGPIETAGIILGNEPEVQVPIQIIDSTFSNSSTTCRNAEAGPTTGGFNGILGVGFFAQDCGNLCATQAANNLYYTCTGSTCTATTASLSNQVQNPIALLPEDNNGVIVELPVVPATGQTSAEGYLILGIGTQSNNQPSGVTAFPANATGEFQTKFNGNTYSSFLDTGSNGLFFPAPTVSPIPDCSTLNPSLAGWFCPTSTESLSAVNIASAGNLSNTILFQIGDLATLASGSNSVFLDVGANISGTIFDWGLPFFLGRNVYVGFQGATSKLGTGPYWAY